MFLTHFNTKANAVAGGIISDMTVSPT